MKFICADIMTPDPVCCKESDSVRKVAELMRDEDIGPIPVIDDQFRLVGIVTDRDLVLNVLAKGLDAANAKVSEAMTRDPVSCKEDDALEDALDKMSSYQVRRLPVVNSDERIIGIIAQADIATRIENPEIAGEVVQEVSK